MISIILAYLVLTIAIGLLSKKTSNANAYEGFKLSLLMCVAIGAGEWMGGTSTTGVSEYGYLYGISGAWYTIANGIGICFLALFFAKLFRSLNTSTVPEIIGRYLGRKSRIISSILLTLVLMIVGVSQMIAIGTIGETILSLNPALSSCILGLGVLIYTCVGGMNAIGTTNILHMIVMYVGVIMALFLCFLSGEDSLKNLLPSQYFSPVSIGYEKLFSWIIASVLGACTAQAGLQPILKAKDEKTAVKASCLIALIVAPFGILTALLGMYARAIYPNLANAKLALPTLLMNMNPYVSGFVMAAILAAVLSTASPIFLSCGTLITRDLYGELHNKADDKQLLRVSRIATFTVGVICIALSVFLSRTSTILDIVYFAYSLRGSLFVVLLLGIFWKKMTQRAAIYAMLSTAIVGFAWVGYKKLYGSYPIAYITETYISVLTAIIVSVSLGIIMYRNRIIQLKGYKMRKTVVEYVAEYARSIPDKIAVITAENSITYKELFQRACDYAEYLKEYGIKKGNIIVLKASQTVDYAIQYLGIHLAGGIVTSLERSISDKGMVDIAKKIQAHAIISDNVLMSELYSALYISVTIPVTPPPDSGDKDTHSSSAIKFPDLEDSADILFTTGTTGSSKGVELSHKALVATAENLIYGCGYKKDTVIIVPGPLNHANAIRKLFTTFVNGSTIYLLNGMTNVKAFFTALDNLSATGSLVACCLPPAAIRTIFQLTGDRIGSYKIDFIESATSPLPEADKERLCELLPQTRLYNNYGSSEAASVCMYNYNEYRNKSDCVGKAMPNSKIIIVDDEHNEIKSSRDNIGLIACVGDVNMKGYVNEPALTKEVLVNGIVYTSDLGYIDEEDFIYVVSRKGDVINVGGLKVAPTEVESVLLGFEGILDCICISVPDNITTNALKLLVVLDKNVELDIKQLNAYLAKHLEPHKVPRFYEQVDKIERTYNGKLNRKFYRETR